MQICEATVKRIRELLKRDRLTLYALSYKTGMPLSTLKCILNGRSKNPGIVNIQKIAEGFNMSIREFIPAICLTIWNRRIEPLLLTWYQAQKQAVKGL